MPTSSAEPDRLEAYPGQLASANEQLTTLAAELDTAMRDFASGASAYLPAGFDATEAGNLVRGLRDESRYLEDWVVSVARAFRAADGDPDGNGIFSANDSFIDDRVGQATIAGQRAEIRGRRAAHDLSDALTAMGIDPTDLSPAELQQLVSSSGDANFRELYEQMQGIAEDMHDPAFATGFHDAMGAEGIRTTLGVIDAFASARRDVAGTEWMGSVQDTLLAPFVGGWALATRSPETEDERAALLDTTNPVEQHHLSLLMSGDPASYDAEWLADGADRILVTGRHLNPVLALEGDHRPLGPESYPGLRHQSGEWGYYTDWLYDDHGLNVPTLVATRALDGNDEAALNFMLRGPDRIHELAYPDPLPLSPDGPFHEDAERLRNELQTRGANTIRSGATHEDPAVREALMTDVIDVVIDEPQRLNRHMYGSLAAGVEHNMELINENINSGWSRSGESYTHDSADQTMTRTQDFLTELMGDKEARNTVRDATNDYVQERRDSLPVGADGERPEDDLNELGRVFGTVADADIAAVTDQFKSDGDAAANVGRLANYVVSWTPAGPANETLATVKADIGSWIEEGLSPDDAEFQQRLRNLLIEYRQDIEGQPLPSDDIAQMRRGADDAATYS
jgi:hypothetical protein